MGIRTHKIEQHWNYFLAIERDVDHLSRYVEFDEKNFACFSIEIARILLASAAEVDVVSKQICGTLDPRSKAETIVAYRNEIVKAYPDIPDFEILLPRFGLTLKPWDEWRKPDGVPLWWTAYNKIKHQRDSQYARANLKNALNSVAGLFVMALHLYRNQAQAGKLAPAPELFRVDEQHIGAIVHLGHEFGIKYLLPGTD